MNIINYSLLSFLLSGFPNTTISGTWILSTGVWDDTGIWDDTDTWNDI